MDVKGASAIVTGGASGLGAATAAALADLGTRVLNTGSTGGSGPRSSRAAGRRFRPG